MSGEADADPFDVLGVGPDCGDDEIRAAFRRVAATCHPDSQAGRSDPDAAARFRACVAARDALLDPASRAEAARRRASASAPGAAAFGTAFDRFFDNIDRNGRGAPQGGGAPGTRPRRGSDVDRAVGLTLEQAFRGGSFVLRNAPGPCAPCSGTGKVRVREARPCDLCGGRGRTRQTRGIITVEAECASCAGVGTVREAPCPACSGIGRNEGDGAPYEVPPGARDGMLNVLRGYGAPGFLGGPRGDLRLLYRIRPHPVFGRDGDDLTATLRVPVWDAAMGCRREMVGIDGKPVEIDVPRGTAGGTVLAFPGRGMPAFPGRGELRVEVLVDVPPADTPAIRQAYAMLRAASAAAGAGTRGGGAADEGEGAAADGAKAAT